MSWKFSNEEQNVSRDGRFENICKKITKFLTLNKIINFNF